ncbi:MAG: stage II sporulation protein M [Chthonomonadales bacterium]|nr:stage II sporulation protein M [Chthonomonadales bacterium]
MDEREFVQSRQATWQRLGAILEKATTGRGVRCLDAGELRELGPLYRRAAADLAYARAHAITGSLVTHLNHLVARSYGLLYQADTRSWSGLRRFFTEEFPRTFRRRLPEFGVAVLALVVGFLVSYSLVAASRANIDLFVPPGSDFRSSLEAWTSGKTSDGRPDGEAAVFASFLMTNNIRVSFVAFALGIAGGVLTVALIFYNGCMLGAFAGATLHAHQLGGFWAGVAPHGVVELSETCIAGAAGIALGWALLAPGPYRRRDALVLAARDAVRLILGGIALLIFAGVVEAFISHSAMPRAAKIAFGLASGVALYGYLFASGRGVEPERDSLEPPSRALTGASAPSPPGTG